VHLQYIFHSGLSVFFIVQFNFKLRVVASGLYKHYMEGTVCHSKRKIGAEFQVWGCNPNNNLQILLQN